MANINNKKESFELLRGSFDSNSFSDGSEIVFPMRKKRYRRRLKNNPTIQHEEKSKLCDCKMRTLGITLFCVVSLCWLIVLTWLNVVLHSELNRLTSHVSRVVAGNQGVPDALQKCHSVSKDLQKNQSLIMSRLNGFSLQLANFSAGMAEIKSGLRAVQDQLRSSPDLVNIPRLIEDLSTSVASFGSQIKDLNSTVSGLKDQNVNRDNTVGNLVNNLTEIKMKIKELSRNDMVKDDAGQKQAMSAEKEAMYAIINQISRNISNFNDTLSSKLQWTLEDQSKDHKLLESLREMSENLTSRVKTLETICAKNNNSGSHLSPIPRKSTVLPESHFLFSEKQQANKSDSIENG